MRCEICGRPATTVVELRDVDDRAFYGRQYTYPLVTFLDLCEPCGLYGIDLEDADQPAYRATRASHRAVDDHLEMAFEDSISGGGD
jgi:hypothetical protein